MRGLLTKPGPERWPCHVAVQIESAVADRAKLEEVNPLFPKVFLELEDHVYLGQHAAIRGQTYTPGAGVAHG